ncbi:kinesin-like protein KIN-7I isoform X4 [Zea mays]|uniref:kinesin-like protein KIN-7I isoform X4 n=1 Tax=Zea mays TaxID=4577 RepID=UPI0009AA747A|nr:kinesin-like protein KIN-7I isoform X4 [Zea mays]|eukprot:XP_020396532.1 kinesin-like protein KIN-7I isoform X4 [Zea mays]
MERIHVAVRSRPLSPEDSRSSPWKISGNAIAHSAQSSSRFEFDRIFGEECRTAEVYQARIKHIVDNVVRGFNGTVFAYGQTNSGKTFTMRGSANEPGIIPLAVHDLFQRIQEHMDREFLVRMSYMEIYNEDINDLLVPEHRKLQIHESIEKGIFVAGLREEIVTCAEQVMDFMSFGESHRHIGETNMNLYSSRSHTIFRMVIESREKGDDNEVEDFCDAVRVSVLNLVDLAGSERAAKTGAEGVRLKEGSHINKSLMTLGTVIKKLSEGIESQGGHVPYRDSKLTRILQPALGGNSNTAIICNITLAQIHTDETKSSLQFASRALRVTNCACVNEILTDAALLKRQRKEIEELRAKLRKSESDHWEEEILNLRNTLLQSELEKERISLELEEEKKAKEQRDRCLIEQAKKIENLSSLVLNSDRDDRSTAFSKNKRRVTWCPGPNAKQFDIEDLRPVQEGSTSSTVRNERDMGMPPLFEELMQESNDEPCANVYSSGPGNVSKDSEDVPLPDSHALLHVTNRRKPKAMKSDQEQFRGRAGELLIPQDPCDGNDALRHKNTVPCVVSSLSSRESEAILVIKQLQDQIKLLEAEKSSVQTNLDAVLVLATQQKVSFNEEYEELQQITLAAEEQAKVANENLSTLSATVKSKQELAYEFLGNLLMETQGINVEMDQWRNSVDSALSFIDELFQNLCIMAQGIREVNHSAHEDSARSCSVIRDYEKLSTCLMDKVYKLELEKKLLEEQSQDQQNEIYKLKANLESCEKAIDDCTLQHELEKDAILLELLNLQKEVSILSSSSLMKEKESIRKELDRTKSKLRETEDKLKNSIQEKTKLQSEKAEAHKEIKKLQSQRTLLERDLRKRDSATVDKRHELNSMPQESSGAFGHMQENYQNLEMHAFDMDAEIYSLQEALVTSIDEKDEALSKVGLITSELEDLANKLNLAESERNSFSNEITLLTEKLIASESSLKSLETSLNSVSREKEDLGMQLTDALLDMESERSIWTAKEKEYVEANHRLNICLDENHKLSEDLMKVMQELGCCREQCKTMEDKLVLSMKSDMNEKVTECSEACKASDQIVENGGTIPGAACENMRSMVAEAEVLKENCNRKLIHAKDTIDELSSRISVMEANLKNDTASNNKEKTKLRMEIRWLRPQLDAHRGRLKEAMNEMKTMDAKYQEACTTLKKDLSQHGREILRLREMLKESQSASN